MLNLSCSFRSVVNNLRWERTRDASGYFLQERVLVPGGATPFSGALEEYFEGFQGDLDVS